MKALWIPALILGVQIPVHAVELGTAPLWFFEGLPPGQGVTNCLVVNLHDRPVRIRITLIYHDEDEFTFGGGFPIGPGIDQNEVEQVLEPGHATSVTADGLSFDALLVRCTVEYRGNPRKVKAALVLEHTDNGKSIAVPADIVRFENNASDPMS
ncbi:MAG: hypothetical protein ACREVN_11695 [Gammaproteobacteria bacterium]